MTKIKKGTSDYMRKTPRVLALKASKKSKQQQTQNAAKVAVSRRIPKVKMLREVEDALLCWKSQQEEGTINQATPLSGKAILSSDHCIPDKNILEFVIDTLQRKDKNEFFAEPVDGDEVEEYYDYIKNPMDFGTMRAKLHKGIYTTLKQFQDDVYLISNNALTFNASSTVYYREASVIQKLADRLFSTLETNPENFIEAFLKKKDYGQKSKYETEGAKDDNKTKQKKVARGRSSELKNMASLNFNKSGWRHTYEPPTSMEETIVCSSKHLLPVNDGEPRQLGYLESPRRFAKDLGPVAQNVANQKQMLVNQMQSRSLLAPYESQANASYNSNVTTDPNAKTAIHRSDPRLKGKMVLGSESLNNNKDETSYLRMITEDSPPFVGPRSSVSPSTIVRESSFGLSGNMFQPSSNFSQMTQQPMNSLGTKNAYVQQQNMIATQSAYVQPQNMLRPQNSYFQQQDNPSAQKAYFQPNSQQQSIISTQNANLQHQTIRRTQNANLQHQAIRGTQNANLQHQTIRKTQNANLQRQTIRGSQNANLLHQKLLDTHTAYLQKPNILGTQHAYLQKKNPFGKQSANFQLQNPSSTQTSILELLNHSGTQNSFSQPQNRSGAQTSFPQLQNPSGAQPSFLQMMNPWGPQNSYMQMMNQYAGKQPDNINQSQVVDPRLRMKNPKI